MPVRCFYSLFILLPHFSLLMTKLTPLPAPQHTYTTEKWKKPQSVKFGGQTLDLRLDFLFLVSINHEKRNPATPLTSNAANIYPTCLSGQVPFTVFVCACACVGV